MLKIAQFLRTPVPRPWLWVSFYLTLHFLMVPLVPTLEMQIYAVMHGVEHVERIINTCLAVFLACVVIFVFLKSNRPLLALTLLAITAFIGLTITENPDERIHFIQYAVLAMLIHYARPGYNSKRLLEILSLVALTGMADETFQYLLPDRYFDLRDAFMDTVGGALGLGLLVAFKPVPSPEKQSANKDTKKK